MHYRHPLRTAGRARGGRVPVSLAARQKAAGCSAAAWRYGGRLPACGSLRSPWQRSGLVSGGDARHPGPGSTSPGVSSPPGPSAAGRQRRQKAAERSHSFSFEVCSRGARFGFRGSQGYCAARVPPEACMPLPTPNPSGDGRGPIRRNLAHYGCARPGTLRVQGRRPTVTLWIDPPFGGVSRPAAFQPREARAGMTSRQPG
jgi:hypothetical protein